MMALFIVLWLLNSSEQVRKAISAYFQDPSGTGKQSGSAGRGHGRSRFGQQRQHGQLKDKLEQALKKSPEFEKLKDYVQMSVTGEGLRVELMESEKGMFFESGSPDDPTEVGQELIESLARELGKLPNDLLIEGHTDAEPFSGEERILQLGAIDRPRQCGAPADGSGRPAARSGERSSRVRRRKFASEGQSR